MCGGGGGLVTKSCQTLVTPGTISLQIFCLWDFPGKNTGVGCHFLLQGIFLELGSNPRFLQWQADSLPWNHQGSPRSQITDSYCQYMFNFLRNCQTV